MLTRGRHERLACLLDGALDSVDDMMRKRVAVALLGLFGHAVYFVLWTYFIVQPYEAPGLRIVLASMFLIFLLPRRMVQRLEAVWSAYWHLTLMLNLPFFFTYMAVRNDTWLWVSGMQAAYLLVFLLTSGVLTAAVLISGSLLGIACALPYSLNGSTSVALQAWPVIAFSLLAAAVLSRSQQQHSRRKTAALLSYAGYIAHELRTPLASIAARASLSRSSDAQHNIEGQQHLQELSLEVQRSFALIDILLTNIDPMRHALAGTRSGFDPVAQETRISEILQAAMLRYPFRDAGARAGVEVNVVDDCVVRGSPLLLQHVVMNLVRNAFEHSMSGACVKLGITARRRARDCEILVVDNGQGFASKPWGQAGLGLLFCRSVARSIGGELRVQSPATGGCTLSLCLPSSS